MEELLIPILLVIAGLLVGVAIKSMSGHIKIPYTVVLFAVGIILGVLARYDVFSALPELNKGLRDVATMDPNFILYVFLPVLVFDAAYEMNLHIFRKTLLNASILAGPGLVICMLLTAAMILGLNCLIPAGNGDSWNWTFAFMFGGLISATDPVAVVALLQELKTSKRFSTLVDGESLLNDGTGIVCFMIFYSQFAGQNITMNPAFYFLWVVVGSFVIGYIIARITLWFITRVCSDEILQNTAMIMAAYITFIIAQHVFDISGVIALVVYGHHIAQKGRPHLKPQVNLFMEKFWSLLAYIANTLIFIIVGVIIASNVNLTWEKCINLFIIFVGIIIIRYIMIAILYPVMKLSGYGINRKEAVILGWGGLRGALGMSLALMVYNTDSIPMDIREDILLMTAAIVTLTLCINATTSKWLLRKLGLIKVESTARNQMYARINNSLRAKNIQQLDKLHNMTQLQEANWEVVNRYLPAETVVPESVATSHDDVLAELRIKLLDKQREKVVWLYEQGVITQLSYTRLLENIDDLYDSEGHDPLNRHVHMLSRSHIDTLAVIRTLQKRFRFFVNHPWSTAFYMKYVEGNYDVCRGYIIAQQASLDLLDRVDELDIIEQNIEQEIVDKLKDEIKNTIQWAHLILTRIQRNFPRCYKKSVTNKAVRILLAYQRKSVIDMCHDGLITEEDTQNMVHDIDRRQGLGIYD